MRLVTFILENKFHRLCKLSEISKCLGLTPILEDQRYHIKCIKELFIYQVTRETRESIDFVLQLINQILQHITLISHFLIPILWLISLKQIQTTQLILETLENKLWSCWKNNFKKSYFTYFFIVTMPMFLWATNTGNVQRRKYVYK